MAKIKQSEDFYSGLDFDLKAGSAGGIFRV